MSSLDIDKLYQKFVELDKELKELKKEVSEIKWKQQYGHSGDVAYSATSLVPIENYQTYPLSARPFIIWQQAALSNTEQWDENFK